MSMGGIDHKGLGPAEAEQAEARKNEQAAEMRERHAQGELARAAEYRAKAQSQSETSGDPWMRIKSEPVPDRLHKWLGEAGMRP